MNNKVWFLVLSFLIVGLNFLHADIDSYYQKGKSAANRGQYRKAYGAFKKAKSRITSETALLAADDIRYKYAHYLHLYGDVVNENNENPERHYWAATKAYADYIECFFELSATEQNDLEFSSGRAGSKFRHRNAYRAGIYIGRLADQLCKHKYLIKKYRKICGYRPGYSDYYFDQEMIDLFEDSIFIASGQKGPKKGAYERYWLSLADANEGRNKRNISENRESNLMRAHAIRMELGVIDGE